MSVGKLFGVFGLLLLFPALGGFAGLATVAAFLALLLALAAKHQQGVSPGPGAVRGTVLALVLGLGGAWCFSAYPLLGFFWLLTGCYFVAAGWFLKLFAKASQWTL